MGRQRTYAFRLTSEGFQELERDLKKAGDTGEAALNRIRQACPLTANALTQAQESVTRFSAANQNAVAGTRNLGATIQQAGFQVGDFAVQVASGQGVLRPFIQQGSQLLGAFGPWGAVLGAAVAVVGAFATALKDGTDAEEEHTKALDRAKKITEDLTKASGERARALEAERRYLIAKADTELEAAKKSADAQALQLGVPLAPELGPTSQGDNDRLVNSLTLRQRINSLLTRAQSGAFDDGRSGLFGADKSDLEGANKDAKKEFEDGEKAAKKAADAETKAFHEFADTLVKTGEAREKARTAIDDQVEGLRREASAVQESDRARFIANETLKAERTLRQSQLDSGEIEKRIALVQQEAAANYDANQAAKDRDKAAKDAQRATERNQKELANVLEGSFDRVGAAVTQVSLDGENALKNMGNVGKAVAAELAQDFLKLAVLNPLKNSLFGTKSPTLDFGSIFDSLFNGGISSAYGFGGNTGAGGNGLLTFGGPRAGGGRVSAGVTYLVGEKRPELFTPDRDGTILPDARMGGQPKMEVFIDATGADAAGLARVERQLALMNATFERRAVGAIVDARRRGAA